jgi:hypothetical protein
MRNCDGPFIRNPEKGLDVDDFISFSTISTMIVDWVSPYVETRTASLRKES